MSDILAKVEKLIMLATNNPDDNESRSAALKAVQLIGEHKIELHDRSAAPQMPAAPPLWPQQRYDPFAPQPEHYYQQQQAYNEEFQRRMADYWQYQQSSTRRNPT